MLIKTSSHCTGFSLLNSSNSTTQLCWCHQHDDIITLLDRLYQSWTNHFIWQSFSKQLKIIYAKKNMIVGCVSLQWINKNIKKQQWNKWHKSWIFITLCITFPIYLLIFNNTTDMPYLNIMLLTKRIYYSTQKKYQQRATTWINLKLCYNAISKTTAIPAVKRLVTTIRRFRNTVTKFRRNRCTSWIKNNT